MTRRIGCSIESTETSVKLQSNSIMAIISIIFNNYLARFRIDRRTMELLETIEIDPELSFTYKRKSSINSSISNDDDFSGTIAYIDVKHREKSVTKSGLDLIINSGISFELLYDMKFKSRHDDIKYEYVLE